MEKKLFFLLNIQGIPLSIDLLIFVLFQFDFVVFHRYDAGLFELANVVRRVHIAAIEHRIGCWNLRVETQTVVVIE